MSITTSNTELAILYKGALDKVKLEIAAIYQKYGDKLSYSTMQQYNRLTNLELRIADILKGLGASNIKTTSGMIKDVYKTSFIDTNSVIQKLVNVDVALGEVNTDAVNNVLKNDMSRIKWEDSVKANVVGLNAKIKNEIAESLITGDSYSAMSRKLVKKFNISAAQALKISRTEGHRAINQAKIDSYDDSEKAINDLGMTSKRIWRTGGDGRVRDTHSSLNGVPADKNNQWIVGGAITSGPGMSGVAKEDINCRCTTIIEIDE